MSKPDDRDDGLTRRELLTNSALGAAVVAIGPVTLGAAPSVPKELEGPPVPPAAVTLNVNGQAHALQLEPRVTLLDALRENLALTGSKKGCDHGQCGACTVLVGDTRVLSCLTLAVMAQNKPITTIEGLAQGDKLHPMQAAFVEHDGFQCGYCTPGQIMSAVGLTKEPCGAADDDVREGMSGNICRCGAYPNIVDAIQSVRGNRS